MQTVGQCLTECGARLAPFERRLVGRAGCIASLVAIAAAIAALAAGWWRPEGWAASFRFVVLSGLAAALGLFVVYAVAETIVVSGVRRTIERFLRDSGEGIDTLIGAAAMRQEQVAGIRLVLKVLDGIRKETKAPQPGH